jgi:hypothetical protein
MAKSYEIEYTMGIDTTADFMPSERLKIEFEMAEADQEAMKEDMQGVADAAEEDLGEEDAGDGGLMSPALEDEQNAMLGYGDDDEPDMEEEQV